MKNMNINIFSKHLMLSDCSKRYLNKEEADLTKSKKTIEKYREVFSRIIKLFGDIDLKKIDDEFITNMKVKLNSITTRGKPLSASRKNHILTVIRNLLEYLQKEEGIATYDYKKIVKYKVPTKEITYLPMNDLCRLAEAPSNKTFTGLRMRAAIKTGMSTCLRISELLSLKISDLNEGGIVAVRTKGNKSHRVILNKASQDAIKAFLAARGNDECPFIFVTANKKSVKQWQANDFQRSLRNLGKKLGFNINITTHLINRRSIATHWFKEGVPLGVIQAALNHSSSSVTTKFYLGNMAFEDVIKHHKRVMDIDFSQEHSNSINYSNQN